MGGDSLQSLKHPHHPEAQIPMPKMGVAPQSQACHAAPTPRRRWAKARIYLGWGWSDLPFCLKKGGWGVLLHWQAEVPLMGQAGPAGFCCPISWHFLLSPLGMIL